MGKKYKAILGILFLVGVGLLLTFLVRGHSVPVLDPKGPIAEQQLDLLVFGSLLSLAVVIPVFVLTYWIVRKYRATNTKTHKIGSKSYQPEWDHSTVAETVWWGIPILLVVILGGVIWSSSHKLDPYKPLASDKKALEIQVVALQWKWLFIYPEQKIATINYLPVPRDTPINFTITADSPMNSFWVPQLSGQVYAMSGMSTKLHFMATSNGEYKGVSANLSGEGYAGMKFVVKATDQTDFTTWVASAQKSSDSLSTESYPALAKASKNNKQATYLLETASLYDDIVAKYMTHDTKMSERNHNE